MKIVVVEDYLFFTGYAKNYVSAVDCLMNQGWLTDEFKIKPLFNDKAKTIKEILGDNWSTIIKGWDIEKFNDYFDGEFYMYERDVWEA